MTLCDQGKTVRLKQGDSVKGIDETSLDVGTDVSDHTYLIHPFPHRFPPVTPNTSSLTFHYFISSLIDSLIDPY
jgi:hypothetical protein